MCSDEPYAGSRVVMGGCRFCADQGRFRRVARFRVLVPFAFVNIGRPQTENDEIAKVRLIVPAEKGQQSASQTTTPYLYDLTFERGR